ASTTVETRRGKRSLARSRCVTRRAASSAMAPLPTTMAPRPAASTVQSSRQPSLGSANRATPIGNMADAAPAPTTPTTPPPHAKDRSAEGADRARVLSGERRGQDQHASRRTPIAEVERSSHDADDAQPKVRAGGRAPVEAPLEHGDLLRAVGLGIDVATHPD